MQVYRADWPDRPSGVHLLYVLALAACCAALALLRHRLRPASVVAVVAALAVAVPTGAAATAEPTIVQPALGTLSLASVDPRGRDRKAGSRARTEEVPPRAA